MFGPFRRPSRFFLAATLTLACGGGRGPDPAAVAPVSVASAPSNDFTLDFFTPVEQAPVKLTNLNLLPGTALTQPFRAYWTRGAYSSFGPVTLSLRDVPAGLAVTVDDRPDNPVEINLNEPHVLTLQGQAGLAAGTYGFRLSASFQALTRTLPVVVTWSPAPFSIQAPPASVVTIAQGQSLTFPLHLRHDDVFFEPGTGDPAYVGATRLGWSGTVPAELAIGFPEGLDPAARASADLQITAGASASPGTYEVALLATREGPRPVPAPPLPLSVRVVPASAGPTLWIQDVEWGQSVVGPDLRLVAGKPALLRVLLLADRSGVPAPPVTATIQDAGGEPVDQLVLRGPEKVPAAIGEGDLPGPSAPSGSSYTALLPAPDLRPGMRVTIQAGTLPAMTLAPAVTPGVALDLTVVPVLRRGLAPVLPPDETMTRALMAYWPIREVRLTHRLPYTTALVMPQPGDPDNPAAWAQLLSEMAALRLVDGQAGNYYGFVNPGIDTPFRFGTTGISRIGDGAAVGIDETAARHFQNVDPDLDLPTEVLVHEEGHAFNLNHAPAGGAGNPQLNYPYAGASIGSWGYDPARGQAHDPGQEADVMSYAARRHWISDWNYRSAMAFLEEKAGPPVAALAGAPDPEQWVVSGWVEPGGRVRLSPLLRVACAPQPPRAGDLQLRLESAAGTRTIAFSASEVADLPAGHRLFCFTVPVDGDLSSADILAPGARTLVGRRAAAPATRSRAPEARESAGVLHLEWDAGTHPFVHVLHEGAQRTTLALNLTGGSADLPLAGLPEGGRFVIHASDGLNTVAYASWSAVSPRR